MLFSKLCRGPKSSDSCRPTVVAGFEKIQDVKEDNKVLRCSRSYVELKRVGDGGDFFEPPEPQSVYQRAKTQAPPSDSITAMGHHSLASLPRLYLAFLVAFQGFLLFLQWCNHAEELETSSEAETKWAGSLHQFGKTAQGWELIIHI
jgi:hypothetical protein